MELLDKLFEFVKETCDIFKIDESHALKHSMDVFRYSKLIYEAELVDNPDLEKHKNIIVISAILHDMCDKKYMDEKIGLDRILCFLVNKIREKEIYVILDIISSMSYSTVKKNGFPELGKYQLAFNIVREADLLASYDFDRCVIFSMMHNGASYSESFLNAKRLFETRMFKYIDDNLFTTVCGKKMAIKFHKDTLFNAI